MIRLLCIGKIREKGLQDLQKEYLKRLSAFDRIEITEVRDEPERSSSQKDLERIKDTEAQRVLKQIRPDDFVVLLDLHGTMCDSIRFSEKRVRWMDEGKHLVFVIAGSLGPGRELSERADWYWKLSDLTFPHQLCRILVLEQIYRSFMIETNRRYHK